ncbi:hypothetical protein H5J24_21490 [Chryseobacterium capnotolerans]|nr:MULTISPECIES: hypothetical protein [Chryseobacterium]UHO38112.1 hypothetical protein H5J24_21490 [Chryseobacterium capnotolerans]BAP29362.1 uncharacterized protein CHSO_0325 [Chryseobacterium sp. StRB126]
MKDKLKVFATIAVLMLGIYFIATTIRKNVLEDIDYVNQDYEITNGIVTKKSTYKGNNVWVKYTVNGTEYIESDGFSESENFKVGDTVKVKYSKTKPELMITQFNDQF